MNVIDAVEKVLLESGEPLSYHEITRRVLTAKLWQTEGKTPEATVNARLAVDIADHGSASRFQRTGQGIFALRAWGLPEVAPRFARPKTSAAPKILASPEARPAAQPIASQPTTSSSLPLDAPEPVIRSTPKAAQALSFMEAAERVLEQHSNGKPMHYRAITDKVLELGLVNTKGLTPEATLYAQIFDRYETQSTTRGPSSFRVTRQGSHRADQMGIG